MDLLAGVEKDPEFLAINPAGFIPAIQDGDVTMVESIAIMEYLMARYGPTPLAPDPHDPAFPAYQQFLHLGEAGLAASIYFVVGARNFAPEAERQNWSARQALEVFESRLGLVTRQLARSPYLAGETFTAADISVTYALELAQRELAASSSARRSGPTWPASSGREAYKRAMETCQARRRGPRRPRARSSELLASLWLLSVQRGSRTDERLEGGRVDGNSLAEVDGAPDLAVEAGVEQSRRIGEGGAAGERQLHDALVRFAGADDSVVRPDRNALHFHSSTTLGSACLMSARTRASVSPRQSSSDRILASIRLEGDSLMLVP